jgi:DNA (cytosine-5)-methyltransferase 1
MIIEDVKRIGGLSDTKTQSRTVYDVDGVSPTLCSGMDHGNTMPYICEKSIVAMRGRNPENPSDRTVGSPTVQRLEPNIQGICNTITTVQKDNMVMENRTNWIESKYRIRKLTPNETWRLMDFSDEDFHKAAEKNSSTQLYKQAGNSIVRNVLVAIFGQMLPGKEEVYKNVVS